MSDGGVIAADQLKAFIARVERLEEEKAAIAGDIKEVYSEAKGNGFDPKIMRHIVCLRKMDRDDYSEQQALIELYAAAVGLPGT
ncbi:MAG: DUF2312 domain-containing protein [Alphaproteobacteria bacterium]|nr:DUF2312 domain-containing protein [Alphaproteobacteria bacterium]